MLDEDYTYLWALGSIIEKKKKAKYQNKIMPKYKCTHTVSRHSLYFTYISQLSRDQHRTSKVSGTYF